MHGVRDGVNSAEEHGVLAPLLRLQEIQNVVCTYSTPPYLEAHVWPIKMAKVNKREVPKYSDLKYQGIVFSVFSLFTRSRAMQEIHEERGLISFSFLFTTSLIPSDPKYS